MLTQANSEEFIECSYQRHTNTLPTICWEYKHLMHYCISRIHAKPVSANFCKNILNEFCQHSCQYIGDLLK